MSTSIGALSARANAHKRHHGADSPQYLDARRDHAAASLEEFITRTVATAPPLSDAQRDHLAGLLRPTVERIANVEARVEALTSGA